MDYQVKRYDGKLISYKLVGHNTVPVEVSLLNQSSSYKKRKFYHFKDAILKSVLAFFLLIKFVIARTSVGTLFK
jgi:hypothetical protein